MYKKYKLPNFFRKIVFLLSLVLVLLSLNGQAIALTNPNRTFTDVSEDHWASLHIRSLANHEIIDGKTEQLYCPNEEIKRAELTKLLAEGLVLPETTATLNFSDIPTNHWSYSYIKKVVANGLMNGVSTSLFAPERAATRAEFAKTAILARSMLTNVPEPSPNNSSNFSDLSSSHWAYKYIAQACECGIIKGYPDGTFKPDQPVNRAEAACLIYRSLVGENIEAEEETSSGLTYFRFRRFESTGPLNINVIKVPNGSSVQPRAALAKNQVLGLQKLSSIASSNGAIAAINGDFFGEGIPCGLMIDGELISRPSFASFFAFNTQKNYSIAKASFTGKITSSGGVIRGIDGINEIRDPNYLVVYTPRFNSSTTTNDWGTEVIVQTNLPFLAGEEIIGTVIEKRVDMGNLSIPQNSLVISGHGTSKIWLEENLNVGNLITISTSLDPEWVEDMSVIGGGPSILKDGVVNIINEGFSSNVTIGRAPRTAVGFDEQNNLYLIVIDGRQSYFSVGITLSGLAKELIKLGAKDGINMDGGGSSAMYFNGGIKNFPSGGTERAISNALIFTRL